MNAKEVFDIFVSLFPIILSLVMINFFKHERKSNDRFEKIDNVISKLVDLSVIIEDVIENMDFYKEKFEDVGLDEDELSEWVSDGELIKMIEKMNEAITEIRKSIHYVPRFDTHSLNEYLDNFRKELFRIRISISFESDPIKLLEEFLNITEEFKKDQNEINAKIEEIIKYRDIQ